MTEDDTFVKLRRIPLLQMREIWLSNPLELAPSCDLDSNSLLFEKYGWTPLAYSQAINKLYEGI
jgi:hypothetical protein